MDTSKQYIKMCEMAKEIKINVCNYIGEYYKKFIN